MLEQRSSSKTLQADLSMTEGEVEWLQELLAQLRRQREQSEQEALENGRRLSEAHADSERFRLQVCTSSSRAPN